MISLYKTWLRLLWTGLQFVLLLPSLWNTCVWYGFWMLSATFTGFPVSACQTRRHKRLRFNPWVRKIPGGEHGNPCQYACHEQRSLGLQSTGSQRVRHDWSDLASTHTHFHTIFLISHPDVSWMSCRCVPYEEMQRDAPHNLFGLHRSSELAHVSFRRQHTPLLQAQIPGRPVFPWGVVAGKPHL